MGKIEYRIYKRERFEEQPLYFLQGREKQNIILKILCIENEWGFFNINGRLDTSFCNPYNIYSTYDYDKIVKFKKWVEEKNG